MLDDIFEDTKERMAKSIQALVSSLAKIRTGRAHPSLLDTIELDYYGSMTPLNQLANVTVEDARSLVVSPWEKPLLPQIEKAILKSDLGLNPSSNKDIIRIPLPALTEETRRDLSKQAKNEAENARIAIRNIRRDANQMLKDLVKDKSISEDEEKRGMDEVQKITDMYVKEVESTFQAKEKDLMTI